MVFWLYGFIVFWCYGLMILRFYGLMVLLLYGFMVLYFMVLWLYDFMVLWLYGFMVLWFYSCMASWFYGFIVLWYYGVMALCFQKITNFSFHVSRKILISYPGFSRCYLTVFHHCPVPVFSKHVIFGVPIFWDLCNIIFQKCFQILSYIVWSVLVYLNPSITVPRGPKINKSWNLEVSVLHIIKPKFY